MSLAHWGITATRRHEYDIDAGDELLDEHRVAVLHCIVDDPGGFGALVQRFEPGRFAGHRVRLSGMLRAEQSGAGRAMRVDGAASPSHKSSLGFYNNEDRSLTGILELGRPRTPGWLNRTQLLASLEHQQGARRHADLYITPPVDDEASRRSTGSPRIADMGYRATMEVLEHGGIDSQCRTGQKPTDRAT
ncbi:MAG TPA: hypothetical protein VMZ66_05785 [Aeromicrobium sp.]|nr:hypothetical protein [Aeromicrobium sp.]